MCGVRKGSGLIRLMWPSRPRSTVLKRFFYPLGILASFYFVCFPVAVLRASALCWIDVARVGDLVLFLLLGKEARRADP